ncbi:MAG TPA: rhomboid family intramembrane serine protease [Sedimentisphaerales bacterium]|nr:rhomboid family intramembrane serine protease [Sedimentisphaerales bacterium]
MILPYRTNIRPYRTPYMNYALILINVLLFALTYGPVAQHASQVVFGLRPWVDRFMLTPATPYLWQFVTYAFLHGNMLHIGGNMFFLYLFGDNVNDKLGHLNYLCFYLAGAILSGLGHILVTGAMNPLIGASGAVAAVTGAYLVLFPKSLVTVVYWFFFIGTFDVPAIYFIGLKAILIDNIIARAPAGAGARIAYEAHLSGYAFGIVVILFLLATRVISASHFDLWSILKQWNRRRKYRGVVQSGHDPFTGTAPPKSDTARFSVKSSIDKPQQDRIMALRTDISAMISTGNLATAAEKYLELMSVDPRQILPRQYLLDIANQLMASGRHPESAKAYEDFLVHYPGYEYIEQVELILGILCARYLSDPDRAIKHLEAAKQGLLDPGQIKMCEAELQRLKS